ncbi:MAG: lipoprotein signal peptidase [Limnobacter sp.]|nr:lipoprotein signal peptidase [Limnobacter sp.]
MRKPILPWLGLTAIWLITDQFSKLWVQSALVLGESVSIASFFNFVHVMNPGAAFSFLASQSGWQRHFLAILATVAALVILYLMRQSSHRRLSMFSLSSVLAGALGNLIDRLAHGAVIDFLDFYYQNYHFPAFNVADIAISLGAAGLILDELFFRKNQTNPPRIAFIR